MSSMIKLSGALKRIIYQNQDNYYTIARLEPGRTKESITIAGPMPGVVQGETLELKGEWVTHPKWGDQFKVKTFNILLPASVNSIKAYLESGIIKGIKKELAGMIVEKFKEKTFDIIENEPARLKEIKGIGKAKSKLITDAWNEHHSIRRIMHFLQDRDISVIHASKIITLYGNDALETLKLNPYCLVRDIPESGFFIADKIALKDGISKDDPERIKGFLIHLLLSMEKDGHVFIFKENLIEKCSCIAEIRDTDLKDYESIDRALSDLVTAEEIVVDQGNRVYLKRLYLAEKGIAMRIKAMLSLPAPDKFIDDDIILEEVGSRLAIELSSHQLTIVGNTLKQRVTVITGGPGTGKTTLVRALCAVFKRMKKRVVLGAPTGRAARRLSEVTGKTAKTLHKLLEYDPDDNSFARNHSNPFDLDVFIVDETSMVDTMLMFHLLAALPVNSNLILVGDTFQLPSVGPGNVLSDIIDSSVVKTFYLKEIFRQAELSPIIMNAHAIRNGEMPDLTNQASGENSQALTEFYFLENNSPQRLVKTISLLCSERIKQAFPHVDEIQVLTPMHKGEAGTINLNRKLQLVLNSNQEGIESHGFTFKVNDKVMHLKNNYEKDVFNGDIGVVADIDKSLGIVSVDYYGRIVDYEIPELDQLTLAYAISVHKSQGSEYSSVVIALTINHFPLLQRNLLYTAITRAKHLVIIVGSKKALSTALKNNKTELRLSNLVSRLRE